MDRSEEEKSKLVFLQQENINIRDFLNQLIHETRTPIQIIWSSLENLQHKLDLMGIDRKPIQRQLDNIEFSASILNNNYSNLSLLIRQGDKPTTPIQLRPLNLSQLIKGVVNTFIPAITETKVVLELPKLIIVGDETRLNQVIYNVLSNSIKYSNKKSEIRIKLIPQNQSIKGLNGDFFEIQFHNHGVGITMEDTNKIFEIYYRGEKASKFNPNGAGIGLFIARQIIKMHGGDVRVTNGTSPTILSIFLPSNLKAK